METAIESAFHTPPSGSLSWQDMHNFEPALHDVHAVRKFSHGEVAIACHMDV